MMNEEQQYTLSRMATISLIRRTAVPHSSTAYWPTHDQNDHSWCRRRYNEWVFMWWADTMCWAEGPDVDVVANPVEPSEHIIATHHHDGIVRSIQYLILLALLLAATSPWLFTSQYCLKDEYCGVKGHREIAANTRDSEPWAVEYEADFIWLNISLVSRRSQNPCP